MDQHNPPAIPSVASVCETASHLGKNEGDYVVQLESTLTCPECGHQAVEPMPKNACLFYQDCKGCGKRGVRVAGGRLAQIATCTECRYR